MPTDWASRVELYKQIEAYRERPLIVYVTSKREGAGTNMASDALPYIIEQIDNLPRGSKVVDFLIASYGGDPMVAWRIMTLIRQRVGNVAVLIPHSAYSAATLLALGANEIIMHPNGHLGPVDMQITTFADPGRPKIFSTEDIRAFLDFVRDDLKITDQEHLRVLFEATCKEVGTTGIGFTVRSSKLAVDLGERLLALHMKDDESRSKLRSMVESMSQKFQSHAYPINRKEAKEIGLPINKNRGKKLETMMWNIWLNVEECLQERSPFLILEELLKSGEAAKLFAPVPQLNVPLCAVAASHYNSPIAEVIAAAPDKINPVDFECKRAIVESSRLAHASVTRGKILACRNPDLMINYNCVTTFRGWQKM